MEMSKKNLAVIGYGGQGGWHCQHALTSDVVNLKGIYDIKPERNELARSRGIHAYGSLQELLSDPTIDLVTIATPNDTHLELVLAAVRAGKHVLCEKPAEMTVEAVQKMMDAANRAHKLFTVHQNRRFDVDYLAMRKILRDGCIGEPLRIESRVHGSRGIPSDWRGTREHGGGMILDWGVHLIDQILQLIPDKVRSVYCRVTHYTNEEVDDGFRIELEFESGVTAHIEIGTLNFIPMPRFYLQCRNGTAIIQDWRQKAQVVRCKFWHENDVLPVQTAAGITKTMAPRDEVTTDTFEIEKPESDVHDFYRNYVAAIDGKETQLVTHEQILRVMRVMTASFESAKTGLPVFFEGGL